MKKHNPILNGPYLIWSAAFIVIPLLVIVYYGLTDKNGIFTFENIIKMGTPENLKALLLALLLSLIATAVCLVMAYPLALILVKMKTLATGFIVTIFIIPMWMNSLLRILAWQTLLERNGVINQMLGFLHLPKLYLINTPYAIALGMIYDFLPFMLLPIYNALEKIDPNVVNASYDLGANRFQTFWRVIFPRPQPGADGIHPDLDGRHAALRQGNRSRSGHLIRPGESYEESTVKAVSGLHHHTAVRTHRGADRPQLQ